MYDSTQAYEALLRPGLKYQAVAIGLPLKNLVNEDIATFPGPASYTLKPTVNAITAGGYMLPHLSEGRSSVPRVRPSEAELERIAQARADEICTRPEKTKTKRRRRRKAVDEEEEEMKIVVEGGGGEREEGSRDV
jgi:hypothetical protein